MSIFMKVFILIILFLLLNIVSIYTFSYDDYFRSKKEAIALEDDKGLFKFFGKDFFKKAGYKPSNFVILKKDNQLYLSGTFSSKKVVEQISDFLKINHTLDIKYVENTSIDEELLQSINELVLAMKDMFENGSKLSFNAESLDLEGTLKSVDFEPLLNAIISRIDNNFLKSTIHIAKEENIGFNEESVTKNELIDESEEKNSKKDIKLSKDDIQLQVNNLFSEDKITFERRSAEPTSKSKELLENLATILKQNSSFTIEIGGHTDSRGNKDLNKKLSQDRASRVKEILENFGVENSRITAIGYGNERPIAQDDANGLSEINRRVEFIIGG